MFSLQAKLWEYQWSSVGFWERRREERRGKIIGKQKVRENLQAEERDVGTGFVERGGKGAAVGGEKRWNWPEFRG